MVASVGSPGCRHMLPAHIIIVFIHWVITAVYDNAVEIYKLGKEGITNNGINRESHSTLHPTGGFAIRGRTPCWKCHSEIWLCRWIIHHAHTFSLLWSFAQHKHSTVNAAKSWAVPDYHLQNRSTSEREGEKEVGFFSPPQGAFFFVCVNSKPQS